MVVIEEWANGREKRDSVVVGYCVEQTNKRGLSPIRSDFGVTEQGQKVHSASVVALCLCQYVTPPWMAVDADWAVGLTEVQRVGGDTVGWVACPTVALILTCKWKR